MSVSRTGFRVHMGTASSCLEQGRVGLKGTLCALLSCRVTLDTKNKFENSCKNRIHVKSWYVLCEVTKCRPLSQHLKIAECVGALLSERFGCDANEGTARQTLNGPLWSDGGSCSSGR